LREELRNHPAAKRIASVNKRSIPAKNAGIHFSKISFGEMGRGTPQAGAISKKPVRYRFCHAGIREARSWSSAETRAERRLRR